MTPGRSCPLHYRYPASAFARTPLFTAETLYVVGGLYGNLQAWNTVKRLFEREPATKKQLVLNGDFHWFDISPTLFEQVEAATAAHHCLRGNVETEIASPSEGTGCGCAYPESVDESTVERSNRILSRLRATAQLSLTAVERLAELPMCATAEVGGQRVGLVHGDAESLAGWGFDPDTMNDASHQATMARWFEQAEVDVFASSHTCAAGLKSLSVKGRERVVINNGSAGMPCFSGQTFGVISRIAVTPSPGYLHRLYGEVSRDLHIDAIAVPFDIAAWQASFLAMWPPGSDAHLSYWSRIQQGPPAALEVQT